MDIPEHNPPLPPLPDNLDDSIALENWRSACNAWLAEQAVQRKWLWLKPITTETLREIVDEEKQLRADITRSNETLELEMARTDLNALENDLRATDPQFEAKRKLLLPILKPIFRHIPPANWKALFEQAYARVQISPANLAPAPQQELAEGRRELNALEDRLRTQDPQYAEKKTFLLPIVKPMLERMSPARWAEAFEQAYAGFQPSASASAQTDAEPKPLDWSTCCRIEDECRAYWTKDVENWDRGYIEHEVNSRIVLLELRQAVWTHNLTEQQYRQRVASAWMIAKSLYYALHCTSHSPAGSKPKFFWLHQQLDFQSLDNLCLAEDSKRGFAISKEDLSISAANYLKHEEVRTNHLDWLYLDTLTFVTLDDLARQLFFHRMGSGTNWAAVFAGGNPLRYALLRLLIWCSGPAITYWLAVHGHVTDAIWSIALWGAAVAGNPFHWPARRKGKKLLSHLLDLNRMLGDRTISPRKLREKTDAAIADGAVFDGAVTAIIDRMTARDPTALVHLS